MKKLYNVGKQKINENKNVITVKAKDLNDLKQVKSKLLKFIDIHDVDLDKVIVRVTFFNSFEGVIMNKDLYITAPRTLEDKDISEYLEFELADSRGNTVLPDDTGEFYESLMEADFIDESISKLYKLLIKDKEGK